MRHVEVVCTGNICRSPVGEVVLRAKLAEAGIEDVVVTSSGTDDWHSGDPMDSRAAAALARRGYDGSAHRAQEFRGSWWLERDLVLAMDSGHLTALRRRGGSDTAVPIELFAGDDVPDPYYGEDAGFDDVLDQIEKAADLWVGRLST
ncbi:low molecular weight protein-tyrosine-phosphatase [Kribbella sp. CA-293567]|uniref:low molecular weight protein-tyrosine-phosphatase n=1 Tax=Kribbella sp. CA-293567 TaxID=3002436 RepID=UPI0022DE069B|nr:low molecular weight protein-tyrosine-phosphatase [Kribbella sp. CA-293567]WBQ05711.1 low molecular weight phosphotyrosine protein phosphatase [Kribbella sp. CA-293567]